MGDSTKDFIVGGIIGGILGVTAALLLAPKSGRELQNEFMDSCHDIGDKTCSFANCVNKKGKKLAGTATLKANRWLRFAKNALQELSEDVHETSEEWSDKVKEFKDGRFNDVVELASIGLQLWNKLKK